MSQQNTQFTPSIPARIMPIRCKYCGGDAHLVRRQPALTGDGKGEIRSFACIVCFERTETFVRD
jgi:hypothetical protein